MHKTFVSHDLNHVLLLRQKQNILGDLFLNISSIVGISRRTSCIFLNVSCHPATFVFNDLNTDI